MAKLYPIIRRCALLQRSQTLIGVWNYDCVRDFSNDAYNHHSKRKYLHYAAVVGGAALASVYILYEQRGKHKSISAASPLSVVPVAGNLVDGLPIYSMEEVSHHACKEDGIWVTYGHGVYDITDFVDTHPGGDRILMAAGGSLEPFWLLYAVHKNTSVLEILEKLRIGNLKEIPTDLGFSPGDPYEYEPTRHPALKPASMKPYNAEPPVPSLIESYVIPSELFYVRNHLPVPLVDPKTYKLEITGIGVKNLSFSLDELKSKFPKHTVTAVVQCAGNRRDEMSKVKPVRGLKWGHAAIGNGTWSGVLLTDVLKAAGLRNDQPGIQHIQFEGLDKDADNFYGASIPIERALDPKNEVLLAYEMNGEPLPRDHGFPIRIIVPGVVGARSVKWLCKIVVADEESQSHWQQNDYKSFSPSVDWDTVDFTKSPAIQEFPITSAICQPLEGETVKLTPDGKLDIKGYATSGGGRKIVRVDVTADKGKTWYVADFTAQDGKAKPPYHWGWTQWKVEIPIQPGSKQVEIWVKAVDSSYNAQPESFENIWNLRGVLSNAYHRITVNIKC